MLYYSSHLSLRELFFFLSFAILSDSDTPPKIILMVRALILKVLVLFFSLMLWQMKSSLKTADGNKMRLER